MILDFKYQVYRFCNIYNTSIVLGACPMVAYARAHAEWKLTPVVFVGARLGRATKA